MMARCVCVCVRFFPLFWSTYERCCCFVCRFLFVELCRIEIPVHCVSVTICAYRFYIYYTDRWRHQAGSSSTYLICLKNRTLSLHYLSHTNTHAYSDSSIGSFVFFYTVFAQGPAKIINVCLAKKEITSHQDHLYATKYDISFFIFSDLFILRSLFQLCLSSSHSCSLSPSFISFVLNAFLWDSWLQ